jgi:hypothetical protein
VWKHHKALADLDFGYIHVQHLICLTHSNLQNLTSTTAQLLSRSRRREIEGVGATPKPTVQIQRSKFMYLSHVALISFTGREARTFATVASTGIDLPPVVATARCYRQQRNGRRRRSGALGWSTAQCFNCSRLFRRETCAEAKRTDLLRIQPHHRIRIRISQGAMPVTEGLLNRSQFSITRGKRMLIPRERLTALPFIVVRR